MNGTDGLPATSAEGREAEPTWSVLLVILLLAGLGILTTAGCLLAPRCFMDDATLVFKNPLVNGERPWVDAFLDYHYYQYIPLTFLSYRLNLMVVGPDAIWGFRLVNWLIHSSSAFVIWRILKNLGWSPRSSLFVACAWVVHPMACESVAWVSERSNVLCFLFGSLSFYAYVRWHGQFRGVAGAALAMLLALLSKPIALGWLPVFVALELLGGPRKLAASKGEGVWIWASGQPDGTRPPQREGWQALARLTPLVLLSLVFIALGMGGYETGRVPPPGGTWFTALLTDTDLFLRYAGNIVAPVNLCAMYATRAISSLAELRLWLNVAIWILLVGGSVWVAASPRRALFAWLWYFGGLGPACNLVAIGYPMQDRYTYLSSVGLLLVLVEVSAGIAERGRGVRCLSWTRMRFAGPILGVIYVAFLAALTMRQAPLWGDGLELMREAVERQPDGALPHLFLASALESRAAYCEQAVPPDSAGALESRRAAIVHLKLGMAQSDRDVYDPFIAGSRLGLNLLLTGNPCEAIDVLEKILSGFHAAKKTWLQGGKYVQVASGSAGSVTLPVARVAEAHLLLGEAYLASTMIAPVAEAPGRASRALTHAQAGIQLNPLRFEGFGLLAKIFLFEDAIGPSPTSVTLDAARLRLAMSAQQLESLGREREVQQTLTQPLPPGRIPALGCLAISRAALESATKSKATGSSADEVVNGLRNSIEWARRAASLDPEFGEAFWQQARALKELAGQLRALQPDEAGRAESDCAKALMSIHSDSPRYPQAQQMQNALRKR